MREMLCKVGEGYAGSFRARLELVTSEELFNHKLSIGQCWFSCRACQEFKCLINMQEIRKHDKIDNVLPFTPMGVGQFVGTGGKLLTYIVSFA